MAFKNCTICGSIDPNPRTGECELCKGQGHDPSVITQAEFNRPQREDIEEDENGF